MAVPPETITEDVLTPALLRRFAATFDRSASDALPGLHWCLFLPETPTAVLGPDGHRVRDEAGPVPPATYPRRMWASGDVTWHEDIPVGVPLSRESLVSDVTEKSGRSGPLAFVTIAHRISAAGRLLVEEAQSLVYRGDASVTPPAAPVPAPASDSAPASHLPWPHRRALPVTPPMLLRYSALTFNAHRIHYDRPYALGEEGYPDLVVHGPLLATALMQFAADVLAASLRRFQFRAVMPAFAGEALSLLARTNADGLELAVAGGDGRVCMQASASASARSGA